MKPNLSVFRIAPVLAAVFALAGGVGGCKKAGGRTCHYTAEENTAEHVPGSVYCPAGQECAVHQPVCITSLCGNGTTDDGEQCDDGNLVGGDGCSADCKSDERCGNGVWDKDLVDDLGNKKEPCDQSAPDSPPCTADCKLTGCGNGATEPGEQCDLGTDADGNPLNGSDKICTLSCQLNVCGDGNKLAGYETCDTGPTSKVYRTDCDWTQNQTTCKLCSECQEVTGRSHYCGDGTWDKDHEDCDDGLDNQDATECPYGEASCTICSTRCKKLTLAGPFCGDGQPQGNETCDDFISFFCGTCGSPTDHDASHDNRCKWLGAAQATGTLLFKGSPSDLVGVWFTLDGFSTGSKSFEFSRNGYANNNRIAIDIYDDSANNGSGAFFGPDRIAQEIASRVNQNTGSDQSHPNAVAEYKAWNGEQSQRWGVTLTNRAGGLSSNQKISINNDSHDCLDATGMTGGRGCAVGEPCNGNTDCATNKCQSSICAQ